MLNKSNNTIKSALIYLLRAFLISISGILIAYLILPDPALAPDIQDMCGKESLVNGFARRWDGSCGGWTRQLAIQHIAGDLLHWISYATVSVLIFALHPVSKRRKWSKPTVYLTSSFVFLCGFLHLVDAYSVIYPEYILLGNLKLLNGIISFVSSILIAYGLTSITIQLRREKQQLKRFT